MKHKHMTGRAHGPTLRAWSVLRQRMLRLARDDHNPAVRRAARTWLENFPGDDNAGPPEEVAP